MKTTVKDVCDVVNDWCGIELTEDQAMEILNDPNLKDDISHWGVFDTTTRESIADFLAKKIVGRDWPTGQDPVSVMESFWAQLRTKGKELGYKVHPTE